MDLQQISYSEVVLFIVYLSDPGLIEALETDEFCPESAVTLLFPEVIAVSLKLKVELTIPQEMNIPK